MSRPKRIDANQPEIVSAMRQCAVFVADTHELGHGHPDLLTYSARAGWIPIEVKDKTGKLTPDETEWWQRAGVEPVIVRTVNEALTLHGIKINE